MQKNAKAISGLFLLVIVIYQCIWHLALPIVLVRLWWKGRKEPHYRKNILERLGFYPKRDFKDAIWIHAVSVGETRASEQIIEQLIAKGYRVLLTHTTPTGRKTGAELFKKNIAQGQVLQTYIPYDFCWPIGRFFRHFKPKMGLMMETEIWPSILFFARKKVPIYLINGRLSLKSSLSFAKFGGLSKTLFGLFEKVLAQTQSDAEHYQLFDVQNCQVTGNLKFDVQLAPEQIEQGQIWKAKLKHRQVICLASSREGEEKIVIQAWQKLMTTPKPILLIVPRHLTRLGDIEKLLHQENITYGKRSQIGLPDLINEDIFLGDTMGEMGIYLSVADYVIMGGTLMGTGGQNLIEPISIGKPVILGPSTYNFKDISLAAVAAGIATQIKQSNPEQLVIELNRHMSQLLHDPHRIDAMSMLCADYAQQHKGATQKTMQYLEMN